MRIFIIFLFVVSPVFVDAKTDYDVNDVSIKGDSTLHNVKKKHGEIKNLWCEWLVNPTEIRDPCPEFSWEVNDQSKYQIRVWSTTNDPNRTPELIWNSGEINTDLSICEYAGPPLKNENLYYWHVTVWNRDNTHVEDSPLQKFTVNIKPMPLSLPSVRTFDNNIKGSAQFESTWMNISWNISRPKSGMVGYVLDRSIASTILIPHPSTGQKLYEKAAALEQYCISKGLTKRGISEEMFCHYAEDSQATLSEDDLRTTGEHTRIIPGWDPNNDRNKDGLVDDEEFKNRVNLKAGARTLKGARIFVCQIGPPNQQLLMNVGNPDYQEFMAEYSLSIGRKYDGVWFDHTHYDFSTVPIRTKVLEYSDVSKWSKDMQRLFAKIKMQLPQRLIIGNCWRGSPMILDGVQSECWQQLTRRPDIWQRSVDEAIAIDQRGKIQLLQYNMIYLPELSYLGEKVPVSIERDRMFGFATYLMAHGNYTFYTMGQIGLNDPAKIWFPAIRYDLGTPLGKYYLFKEGAVPVFARDYSKGFVLVRPYIGPYLGGLFNDKTAIVYKLPNKFRPLNYDGSLGLPIESITLRNAEAAILVK